MMIEIEIMHITARMNRPVITTIMRAIGLICSSGILLMLSLMIAGAGMVEDMLAVVMLVERGAISVIKTVSIKAVQQRFVDGRWY